MKNLSSEQKNKLNSIINKYFDDVKDIALGCTDAIQHGIQIKDNSKPVKQKYYRVSKVMQDKINEELDRMLELDVVEHSSSEWSSPILMVKKKDGSYRFVTDF